MIWESTGTASIGVAGKTYVGRGTTDGRYLFDITGPLGPKDAEALRSHGLQPSALTEMPTPPTPASPGPSGGPSPADPPAGSPEPATPAQAPPQGDQDSVSGEMAPADTTAGDSVAGADTPAGSADLTLYSRKDLDEMGRPMLIQLAIDLKFPVDGRWSDGRFREEFWLFLKKIKRNA